MNPCNISVLLRKKEREVNYVIHGGKDYTLDTFKDLIEVYASLDYERNRFAIDSILSGDYIASRRWWFKYEIIKDGRLGWCYYEYSRNKRKS